MENGSLLETETTTWCRHAAASIDEPSETCADFIGLAREGVVLRRRWDRTAVDSPERLKLLRLLPAVQTIAQRRLSESMQSADLADSNVIDSDITDSNVAALVELVENQLIEDDRYLAGLLNGQDQSVESVAFAIECFRDDLHWLGTQVAVLGGSQSVDFLGRILLEQEALERQMDAWDPESSENVDTDADADTDVNADADNPRWDTTRLRAAARRLRDTALARQIESLVRGAEPRNASEWFHVWRAAGRLTMRMAPTADGGSREEGSGDSNNPLPADAARTLADRRALAADRCRECLEALPQAEAVVEVERMSQQMSDAANESMTFMEDLPLADAVRNFEILEEDLVTCQGYVESRHDGSLARARRVLGRVRWTVSAELQERRLTWRMERLFGHRFVAGLERLILFLLIFFVIMLAVEVPLLKYEATRRGIVEHSGQSLIEPVFAWIDLGICSLLLAEFSLKMSLARRKLLYLRRNWLTGLLPSIPFGFFAYASSHPLLAEGGEWIVSLRALRYLRLPWLIRWLRIARPALRLLRLVGFMLRASDRLVRQLTPLLNRNLVLFEQGAIRVEEPSYRVKLAALRERFYYRATELIHNLPEAASRRLAKARIDDLTAMLESPKVSRTIPNTTVDGRLAREVPLERIASWLLAATPASISERIGRTLAHGVAHWCQAFDLFGVRRLPLIRDLVTAGRLPSPYDTTARVANRTGLLLKRMLERMYWMADFYGTVTTPQLVDSMGEYMVKGASRPARRMVLLGVAFLAVTYLFSWLSHWMPFLDIEALSLTLRQLIGWPLVALGCLCLVVFGLGIWFRRIAGEATDFYTQVAQAQFIAATKQLKHRLAGRYEFVLYRRVIAPELAIAGNGRTLENESDSNESDNDRSTNDESGNEDAGNEDAGLDQVDGARAAVNLLWHDYLDGAPFQHDDTRTTSQLLGNLVLVSLRETRLGYNRRQRKNLRRLDLTGTRMSMRGPYLWFHFISRSLAQQTARLVVDYNAHALPLSRAATADDRTVHEYIVWLERRFHQPVDQLDLPAEFRDRWADLSRHIERKPAFGTRSRCFEGNDFTAIHFLSADPNTEADVRRRYGDQVADLMRRDRRDNIRRVFQTYPFHHWPKEKRTFNPLTLYQRHLAGGRILLIPVKLVGWTVVWLARLLKLLRTIIQDVLHPSETDFSSLAEADSFEVAVRKIHRMRKPLFLECLRMRAEFDPEYLGIVLPGQGAGRRQTAVVEIQNDLKTIRAEPSVREEFRRLASLRRRQVIEFRYWLGRFGARKLPKRSIRAMTLAYITDHEDLRTRLESTRRIERAFKTVVEDESRLPSPTHAKIGRLWTAWHRWQWNDRFDRLFRQPVFSRFSDTQRAACQHLILQDGGPLREAVKHLTDETNADRNPVEDARMLLLDVAKDPDPWSRQLVILRAVQTLSVLDLEAYRDLVAELGEYTTTAATAGRV